MVRFIWVIVVCFFLILYYVPKMSHYAKHPEKYDEDDCYELAKVVCTHVRKRSFIKTVVTGVENLPQDGGYIMYANHQGKYDVVGMVCSHDKPFSYVIDAKRSKLFIADQLTAMLRGKRLNKESVRQQVQVINDVAAEIKQGKRYLLFPEGGYDRNHNILSEFSPGSFKIAQRAKCPIVPVVLYDSYKAYEGPHLKPLTTQIAFLQPILYDEIDGCSTKEIRDLVVEKISNKLDSMETLNSW